MTVRKREKSTIDNGLDATKSAAQTIEKRIENALIVLWDDLPSWQQDNHYIHSGYRPESGSFKKSFSSLGYVHNESVNIYTHLLGAIFFTVGGALLYTTVRPRYATADVSDIIAFGCFFLGAALCLGMSATYHTISNHSPMVAKFGNKLDYVGIVCLITGSFIPSVFYGFYCHPHLQEFYWTMVREAPCHMPMHQMLTTNCRYVRWDWAVPQCRSSRNSERPHGDHIELVCSSQWAHQPSFQSFMALKCMVSTQCATALA